MTDLIEFLRARLDEDETMARATEHADGPRTLVWRRGGARRLTFDNGCHESYEAVFTGAWDRVLVARDTLAGAPIATHVARWDPARILVEVEAKRAILRLQELAIEYGSPATPTCPSNPRCACNPCLAVYALARVHVDHPDFDPAWRRDD